MARVNATVSKVDRPLRKIAIASAAVSALVNLGYRQAEAFTAIAKVAQEHGAKATVDDRVRGLQAGGDDYLTKPFAFSELLARVQALIRRATQAPEATRLTVGDVALDLVTREVTRGGERVELQPREFTLLAFLLRHAGRPVTKTMLLEHVWDYSFDPQTNVVDVVVHRLRAKIDPDKTRLETIRGVGYLWRGHA